jgi:hypothetical protein
MHLQVPNNLINAIKSLYETTLIKIKADQGKTTEVFLNKPRVKTRMEFN